MIDLMVLVDETQWAALAQRLDPAVVPAAQQEAMAAAVAFAHDDLYRNYPVGVSDQHTRDRFETSVEQDASGVTGYVVSNDIQALVMEEGRTPGAKMPPSSAIADWVGAKLGDAGLAFVVARAIGQRGIRAHHTFQAAAERTQEQLGAIFEPVLARLLG